ncbi:MAG: hypothetical protein ACT4PJ_03945 [Gemmatimonadaceae bacterium]
MRPTVKAILVGVVVIAALYLVLRSAAPSRSATGEVPVDTMCLASRIGLPCAQ